MKKLYFLALLFLPFSLLFSQEQVALTGSLHDFDIKALFVETVARVSGDETIREEIILDGERNFSLKLDLPTSQQFKLQLGSLILPLFLEPGDSLHLSLEALNDQVVVKYTGPGSVNNTFLSKFATYEQQIGTGALEAALQNKDADEYWTLAHKLNEIKTTFFEQYLEKSKKTLSPTFETFFGNQIKYHLINDLLAFPVFHSTMINLKVFKLPTTYKTFLDEITLADDAALPCVSYQSALINFINYKNNQNYTSEIEDQLKQLADSYKLAGDLYQNATEHYAKYGILKALLKKDYVYAAFEYEDFLKSSAPQDLKDAIIRFFQIKSMKLEGLPMPDIQIVDKVGEAIHVSDLRGKILYLCLWKNDANTDTELTNYLRLFGKKITADPKVHFGFVYANDNDNAWRLVLSRQKRNLPFVTHYKLDFSDNLTKNFALRTDDYGPWFILIDETGNVVRENAYFQFEFNPNTRIRKMLKE